MLKGLLKKGWEKGNIENFVKVSQIFGVNEGQNLGLYFLIFYLKVNILETFIKVFKNHRHFEYLIT